MSQNLKRRTWVMLGKSSKGLWPAFYPESSYRGDQQVWETPGPPGEPVGVIFVGFTPAFIPILLPPALVTANATGYFLQQAAGALCGHFSKRTQIPAKGGFLFGDKTRGRPSIQLPKRRTLNTLELVRG